MPRIIEPSSRAIEEAADALRRGRVVAFPTETVYGLAADTFSEAALDAVFALKGRPADNPLIAHVTGAEGPAGARRPLAPPSDITVDSIRQLVTMLSRARLRLIGNCDRIRHHAFEDSGRNIRDFDRVIDGDVDQVGAYNNQAVKHFNSIVYGDAEALADGHSISDFNGIDNRYFEKSHRSYP